MVKSMLMLLNSSESFDSFFERSIDAVIIASVLFILGIYGKKIGNAILQVANWIGKLWRGNKLKRYKIDDLIFEYYPILNDWKSSIRILSHKEVDVMHVNTDVFPLDTTMFPGKSMNEESPKNMERIRLNNYKIKFGSLRVSFQKTKYAHYLNSNEYLDKPYLNQDRTYRDVLLKQIEKGDIEYFPLTNICGAGIFSITSDKYLVISKHSSQSKVYPSIITFTASGVLNWRDDTSNANPFRGMLEIYKAKIGIDLKDTEIKMIGFGADARKLYFQFSFFEKSKYNFKELESSQMMKNQNLSGDEKRNLIAIPHKLENIVESLFTNIWEPAAEVALLTYCVKELGGRNKVLKALKQNEKHWQERNTRNEFEYRCSSRKGDLADLSTSIPFDELDEVSNRNIEDVFAFIGKENLCEKIVLEIGCGTGRITKRMLDFKPKKIYCIEVSPCMMQKHFQIEENEHTKIFRVQKYFQHWDEKQGLDKKFQIAICSLVLIHNKEFESVIEKLCLIVTEKIFVMEDITEPWARQRPISQYTFLQKKEELIKAFNKHGGELVCCEEKKLYNDSLIFLEFNLIPMKMHKRRNDLVKR